MQNTTANELYLKELKDKGSSCKLRMIIIDYIIAFFVHYTNDLLIVKHTGVYYNENYNLSSYHEKYAVTLFCTIIRDIRSYNRFVYHFFYY